MVVFVGGLVEGGIRVVIFGIVVVVGGTVEGAPFSEDVVVVSSIGIVGVVGIVDNGVVVNEKMVVVVVVLMLQ